MGMRMQKGTGTTGVTTIPLLVHRRDELNLKYTLKVFVAHFTTDIVINVGKQIFCC